MITATHKGSQTTRNSSFFKKIPEPAHNLLDYPSSEDESYTHTTRIYRQPNTTHNSKPQAFKQNKTASQKIWSLTKKKKKKKKHTCTQ